MSSDRQKEEERRGESPETVGEAGTHEWLKAMINHVPDFIYAKDLDGRFLFANEAVVKNNGLSHVDDIIGLTDYDLHPSAFARTIEEIEQKVIATGEPDLGQEEPRLKGHGWLMMSRVPLRDHQGEVIGVVGASRDISARKRSEELLRAQAKMLEDVARGVDIQSFIRGVTDDLNELLQSRSVRVVLDGHVNDHETGALVFPIGSRDGGKHGIVLVYDLSVQERGLMEFITAVAQTIGIAIDRSLDVERIAHLAEHDVLTGLPNRASIERTLQAMLSRARSGQNRIGVAFLDLDNFKLVNDSLGHGAGDELLKITAERIVRAVGNRQAASRVGGDEFMILLEKPTLSAVRDELEGVRAAIAAPVNVCGVDLRITASIGFVCADGPGSNSAHLPANADLALYEVKNGGRNGVRMFTPLMAEDARTKLERVEELRRAVERGEFVVHYQAQLDTATRRVVGVEALVRWNHPTKGLLYPSEFISLAEETGLIVPIGEAVLAEACAQARDWQLRGIKHVTVAVNVSARQFLEPSLAAKVRRVLAEVGLAPEHLELEVTESSIMLDVEGAIARMHELRDLGASLSIDDFGTGYSSLSMLKAFPLSRLKIDKSFIKDIPASAEDMAITNAIISMAKLLGMQVVAEGVETEEQARFLKRAGCEVCQGYLFARPLPAAEVERMLRSAAHD